MDFAQGVQFLFSVFQRLFDSLVNIKAFGVSLGYTVIAAFIIRSVWLYIFNVRPYELPSVNPNPPGTQFLSSESSAWDRYRRK